MDLRNRAAHISLALLLALEIAGCQGGDDEPTAPPNDPPTIELTAPNGGEFVPPGSSLEILWTAVDDGSVTQVTLSYISMDLNQYRTIATRLPAAGSYHWIVPEEYTFGVKVRALATDDAGQTAEDESDAFLAIMDASPRGYVSSEVCVVCHQQIGYEIEESGHSYILSPVVDGLAPGYPHSAVPSPPDGYGWNDITYVIGGYGWKAQFLDDQGYVMTEETHGAPAQYNLEREDLDPGLASEWVGYPGGPTPYDCGSCHTTGWQAGEGVPQDDLEGILGTWEEDGIRCEACHGPGAIHAASNSIDFIIADTSPELCGRCHSQDGQEILADPPFIRNSQQYEEMMSARHAGETCTSCHNPHRGVRHGNGRQGGIVAPCTSCHPEVTFNAHISLPGLDCVTCHMPHASRSARAAHDFQGDLRTHIFEINSEPVTREEAMFFEEEGLAIARGAVTLDFVCYQCHGDPVSGGGGSSPEKTLHQLSDKANGIHTPGLADD